MHNMLVTLARSASAVALGLFEIAEAAGESAKRLRAGTTTSPSSPHSRKRPKSRGSPDKSSKAQPLTSAGQGAPHRGGNKAREHGSRYGTGGDRGVVNGYRSRWHNAVPRALASTASDGACVVATLVAALQRSVTPLHAAALHKRELSTIIETRDGAAKSRSRALTRIRRKARRQKRLRCVRIRRETARRMRRASARPWRPWPWWTRCCACFAQTMMATVRARPTLRRQTSA